MPQTEIDLDKIIDNAGLLMNLGTSSRQYKKALMREACRQILAIASEKARLRTIHLEFGEVDFRIDKESITNCINFLK